MTPYYLGGYRKALVVPGGNLTVLAASAAQSGGRLQATFRLLLAGSAATIEATPLAVLVAGSDLDAQGAIQQHALDGVRSKSFGGRVSIRELHGWRMWLLTHHLQVAIGAVGAE